MIKLVSQFLVKYFREILIGILIVLVIVLWSLLSNRKKEVIKWKDNYFQRYDSLEISQDLAGRYVTKVKQLSINLDDYKKLIERRDSIILVVQRELKNSKIKAKNTEDVLLTKIEALSSGLGEIRDTVIGSIEGRVIEVDDGYLFFTGIIESQDTLFQYDYEYVDNLVVTNYFEEDIYNDKGKKRFIILRFLFPKWESNTEIKSLNENSKVSMSYKVNFGGKHIKKLKRKIE